MDRKRDVSDRQPFRLTMRFYSAYTLVELLIALSLSLLLLLAVAEMFQRVGGSMQETRSAISVSAQLNEAAMLLRQDLARIEKSLATKPERIKKRLVDAGAEEVSDLDGYLEIIEGFEPILYEGENGEDMTVGDVDDIIAFTLAVNNDAVPYRGLILNNGRLGVEERLAVEIVWFVRGNTLYRRQRLLNDLNPARAAVRDDQGPFTDTVEALADRRYRTLHAFYLSGNAPRDNSPVNKFPYPLYDSDSKYIGWRYLRVPVLEETLHNLWRDSSETLRNGSQWKTIPINDSPILHPDIWEQPHFFPNLQDSRSGALKDYCNLYNTPPDPRHPRAGEDVVLTNVLSFDVKVWCPRTKDFVDLGARETVWDSVADTEWNSHEMVDDTGNMVRKKNQPLLFEPHLPLTWDSWTLKYVDEYPPYTASLEAMRITIRCFDPVSRAIRQVTIVQRFAD